MRRLFGRVGVAGADGVTILPPAEAKIRKARKLGFDGLPVCMAKTQDSLSDNPKLRGRPRGFTLTVRDLEIAAGAGFVVVLTGEIVRQRGTVVLAEIARARAAGVTDAEIVEIVANVALNAFTIYLNIVADTEIDFPVVRASEPLAV